MVRRMTATYETMVVALKCKRAQDIPWSILRDADLVVVKDHRIVKDRFGAEGTISAQRLEELKLDSVEVLILDAEGQVIEVGDD